MMINEVITTIFITKYPIWRPTATILSLAVVQYINLSMLRYIMGNTPLSLVERGGPG